MSLDTTAAPSPVPEASPGRGAIAASKRYLALVVAIFMLINILNVADRELLAPLYDPVSRELSLNDLQFGTIRTAVNLSLIVGIVLFGLIADRWKRRNVLGIAVICWSALTWRTGRAQTFFQLLSARAGMTFFEAAFAPAAYSMISDLVPRRRRGGVMGLMGATFAIGTVTALVVAATLGTANWRQPFIYFGLPGIVLGLLLFAVVREPPRGAAEDEVMEVGGYTGRFGWRALRRTLGIRSAVLIYLLDGCQGSTWWAFAFWAPAYLLRQGIAPDADTAALALLPAIGGFVVGTVLGGWLIDRLRRRTERAAAWVSLISVVGALTMSVVVFALRDLTAVLVAGFFLGLFGYLIMPAVSVMLYDIVPPETRASATAADGVTLSAISAVTSLAIGAVSLYVGQWQGLAEGNLRAGFQGACTVLLVGAVLFCLALLRTLPGDMAALREYVAKRATSLPAGAGE
jgi:MFS family permease